MGRNLILTVAAVSALAVATSSAGAGETPPPTERLSGCGKVNDEGERSSVKAAIIDCEKARALAKDFIQNDELKRKWTTYNPAGCEFFMYKKNDAGEFDYWVESGGSLRTPVGFKLIYFTKFRGCQS